MANGVSTIQSLKAVDAWIDVINANINGGVRTAFKSSRLRFSGSNTALDRPATASTLPLQLPEASLVTANTVIDWSQGAITSSTETSHLAIQGPGFFLLLSPESIETTPGPLFGTTQPATAATRFLVTRDGEFYTDANGFLRTSFGYYLVTYSRAGASPNRAPFHGSGTQNGTSSGVRAVYNDLSGAAPAFGGAVKLSDFAANVTASTGTGFTSIGGSNVNNVSALIDFDGKDKLRYSQYGSTVYDLDYRPDLAGGLGTLSSDLLCKHVIAGEATILSKSLEASNSSMTQSVPELSLAQKLFSALTKVLQINQTNVDSVLNTIR